MSEPTPEQAEHVATIERLTAERDAAREYHGFQRGLRASLARDLDTTMDLKVGLEAEVERLRARAERAEAALVRARDLAVTWAVKAPEDDWGDSVSDTVLADAGRDLLAVLDGPQSDAQPEPVPQEPEAQKKASAPCTCLQDAARQPADPDCPQHGEIR